MIILIIIMFFGCYFNVLRHRGRVYSLLRSLLKNDIFACVQLVNPSPQVSICDARFSSSFFFYYLKCFKGLVTLLSSFISARNVWISFLKQSIECANYIPQMILKITRNVFLFRFSVSEIVVANWTQAILFGYIYTVL